MSDNAFWKDLAADWINPEFRNKFIMEVQNISYDQGYREGYVEGQEDGFKQAISQYTNLYE